MTDSFGRTRSSGLVTVNGSNSGIYLSRLNPYALGSFGHLPQQMAINSYRIAMRVF